MQDVVSKPLGEQLSEEISCVLRKALEIPESLVESKGSRAGREVCRKLQSQKATAYMRCQTCADSFWCGGGVE